MQYVGIYIQPISLSHTHKHPEQTHINPLFSTLYHLHYVGIYLYTIYITHTYHKILNNPYLVCKTVPSIHLACIQVSLSNLKMVIKTAPSIHQVGNLGLLSNHKMVFKTASSTYTLGRQVSLSNCKMAFMNVPSKLGRQESMHHCPISLSHTSQDGIKYCTLYTS